MHPECPPYKSITDLESSDDNSSNTELDSLTEMDTKPSRTPEPALFSYAMKSEQRSSPFQSDVDSDQSEPSSISDFDFDSFQFFDQETVRYYYFLISKFFLILFSL